MRLTRRRIPIGRTQARYTTRLEDEEETYFGSYECWAAQAALLRALADDPCLVSCGPSRFQKVTILHQGRWVAEAEAIVDEESPGEKKGSTPSGA